MTDTELAEELALAKYYQSHGYTISQFRAARISAETMFTLGYNAEDMVKAGYASTELTDVGFSTASTLNPSELVDRANHTGTQLSPTVSNFNPSALLAAPAETRTTIGTLVNGATAKTTPIDADQLPLMDSAASNVIKKLSWLNVKATLKTYFDTLYTGAGVVPTTITVADTTDSTCFVCVFESATGDLAPKTDLGFLYNAATGQAAVNVLGNVTGNVTGDLTGNVTGNTSGTSGSTTGNAATATILQTARTIGGVSFNGSAAIVPQTIESANEATDTTCFPLFITASGTQQLQPKNNTGLTYNSNTNSLAVTTFVGAVTGNVTGNVSGTSGSTTGNAATVTGFSPTSGKILSVVKTMTLTAADDTGSYTFPTGTKTLVATDVTTLSSLAITESQVTNLTSDLALKAPLASPTFTGTVTLPSGQALIAPALGTPASGTLTNCTFPTLNQSTTGSAATLTTARSIGGSSFNGSADITPLNTTVANEGTDTTCFPTFVTAATGDLPQRTNAALTYNSNTGNLGSTTFTGNLTGNVTGNTSGTSGSTTGNALTATTLQNARNIGAVSFNGSADIVPQTIESANEATDTTCFPLFVTAAGTQQLQPKNNAGFIYNSNTNALTATTFVGALTGTASGNLPSGGGTLTGMLQLVAGTTLVAPIKLVAGINLAAPQAGVFEFDGVNLYFTI